MARSITRSMTELNLADTDYRPRFWAVRILIISPLVRPTANVWKSSPRGVWICPKFPKMCTYTPSNYFIR